MALSANLKSKMDAAQTGDTSMSAEDVLPEGGGEAPAAPQFVLVPKAALEMSGSTPEVGDPVEFSVTGTCDSEEGDNYKVKLSTANGRDLPAGEDESEPETADDGSAASIEGPAMKSMGY